MWCLWGERNSRIFNGEESSIPALKFRFLQALFEWLKVADLISSKSISEMLMLCYFLFCSLVFFLLHTSYVHGVFSFNESLPTYQKKKKQFQQTKYTKQRYVIEVSIRTIETENPQFRLH
jgi:hypothetical protein